MVSRFKCLIRCLGVLFQAYYSGTSSLERIYREAGGGGGDDVFPNVTRELCFVLHRPALTLSFRNFQWGGARIV